MEVVSFILIVNHITNRNKKMKETIRCIDCHSNKNIEISLENDIVISKEYVNSNEDDITNLFIGHGLTDLQVNGYCSIDFNTFPILENDFLKVISTLTKEGITTFLPTVITNSDESIIALLSNINDLCKSNSVINSFVGGIHLEGPFISRAEGAKGAHDNKYIKAPDWELFERFQQASGNRIKIVTISPEWDNTTSFIKNCVKHNVIVALGHTVASPEQINEAALAGASMSTHLGNGAPLELARNSNFIFEQLANNKLTASLIADGFHLPDSFLKIALTSKKNKIVLVSDSTMFAGMKSGTYNSHIGGDVILEENSRLSTKSNSKILAGSAVSLLFCVNKLVKTKLSTLNEAWALGSVQPNKLINGNNNRDILNNKTTDLVLFELVDLDIEIKEVFKNNKRVYSKNKKMFLIS
jgi:N-acetylglucosamine-6-phosphate deacetylase